MSSGAEDALLIAAAVVLGLVFGSFATVAAYRIPRRENIVSGRSRCPSCGRTIAAQHNIPVLSYVLLRGRCAYCGTRISIRYPLIELATAVLFGLTAAKFQFSVETIVYSAFFWVLVVLTVIDLDHKLLPNRVVYPSFVAGWFGLTIAALADDEPDRLADAALGALIFGGFFFVVAFIQPHGMGMGDVKLGLVLGTFLGYIGMPGVVLAGMFLSLLSGGIVGAGIMLTGRRRVQVPFGPFLALGTAIAVFAGQSLVDSYIDAV